MRDGRLAGQVALVTGGTRDIGEAIVRRFLAESCKVMFSGRSRDDGDRICKEFGDDVSFTEVDIGDPGSIKASVESAIARFGKLTVLVNNANPGHLLSGPRRIDRSVRDISPTDFTEILRLGLLGACFLPIHFALPHLIASGGGAIVQISSISSIRAVEGAAGYSAAKAAQNAIIRSVAMENARHNIRANAIVLGFVKTDATRPIWSSQEAPSLRKLFPLGVAEPADVAEAALWLACPEGRWMTGQAMTFDGGWTCYAPGTADTVERG